MLLPMLDLAALSRVLSAWMIASVHSGVQHTGVLSEPALLQQFLVENKLKLILRSHEGPDARFKRDDMPPVDKGYALDHDCQSMLLPACALPSYTAIDWLPAFSSLFVLPLYQLGWEITCLMFANIGLKLSHQYLLARRKHVCAVLAFQARFVGEIASVV